MVAKHVRLVVGDNCITIAPFLWTLRAQEKECSVKTLKHATNGVGKIEKYVPNDNEKF